MKKLISILLALLLIFNSAGYIIAYLQLKNYFRNEAFQKLENFVQREDLTTFVISRFDFENENGNFYFVEPNEIKYFGKIYDIANIYYYGDSVRILALNDENEDILYELFDQYFTRTLSDKYSNTASILELIITDSGLPVEFNCVSSSNNDLCDYFTFIPVLKNFFDVPTPPPKNNI